MRAIYTSHVTGTESLRSISDPGTVLSGHVTRKCTGTRKAGEKAFEVSRGDETPPGTAGEDARAWTSATVTARCYLPPVPAANRSLLSAPRMAISRPRGTSLQLRTWCPNPLTTHPQTPAAKKVGAPLRPGHEEMRSQISCDPVP